MFRGLTEKSSHRTLEPEILKGNKWGTKSKKYEIGGHLIKRIQEHIRERNKLSYKGNSGKSSPLLLMEKNRMMQKHGYLI